MTLYPVRGVHDTEVTMATIGKAKIEKVMHEFKEGKLKLRGKSKVTSRKQAVAIALSGAREAGAKIPKTRQA